MHGLEDSQIALSAQYDYMIGVEPAYILYKPFKKHNFKPPNVKLFTVPLSELYLSALLS